MSDFPLPQFHTDEDYIRAVSEAGKVGKLQWQLESLQRRCKPVDRDFLPKPVVRDGKRKFTKNYSYRDWFLKLQEEIFEAFEAGREDVVFDINNLCPIVRRENVDKLAEELTDIITVCTSFLEALGIDQKARAEIQRRVNQKNAARGYFG